VHENPLNGETRRNIFLSVKESLHNIVKHANATKVELVFDMKNDICIRISDNGKGFDLSGITRKGNGLDNIQKRMQEVRGDVKFLNKQGTTVVLRIPFS
jgi:signal transduction histidine kinase